MAWAAAAAGESLQLAMLNPDVKLGEAFDVGLAPSGPEEDLAGSVVTAVQFDTPGEEWHIASDWSQPLSGKAPVEGWLWSARLQAFEPGERAIPAVRVTLRRPDGSMDEVMLQAPVVHVDAGLEGASDELRDLKPIHPFRHDRRLIAAAVAAGVLALLALVTALMRRSSLRRDAAAAFVEPPLPPAEWALREIDRRRRLPACREGDSKAIATEASDVIRRYLQRRYGFPAMELTSAECVERLRGIVASPQLPDRLRDFLSECDMAKFTRVELALPRREAIWEDARELVLRSNPEFKVEAAPAAGAAPAGDATP